VQPFVGQRVAQVAHAVAKGGAVAAVGVDDPHLRPHRGVAADEAGQMLAGTAVVQHVAAHDQPEAALHLVRQWHGGTGPVTLPVLQSGQRVQPGVFQQKGAGQRVAVAGRHVGPAPVAHQAGQAQAAADFEDALAHGHWAQREVRGQVQARRPQ